MAGVRVKATGIAVLALLLIGCSTKRPDVTVLPNGIVIPTSCEPNVHFSGRTVDIQGIKVPLQWGTFTLPIEIAKFYTDRKVVQEATVAAQILDSRRVENCRLLQQLGNVDPSQRLPLILDFRRDSERIHQLALLLSLPCQECVRDWIKAYAGLTQQIAASPGSKSGKTFGPLEALVPLDAFLKAAQ